MTQSIFWQSEKICTNVHSLAPKSNPMITKEKTTTTMKIWSTFIHFHAIECELNHTLDLLRAKWIFFWSKFVLIVWLLCYDCNMFSLIFRAVWMHGIERAHDKSSWYFSLSLSFVFYRSCTHFNLKIKNFIIAVSFVVFAQCFKRSSRTTAFASRNMINFQW